MRSLLQAALYELLVDLDKLISSDEDNLMRQGDILFKNFMKLLEQTKGKKNVRWHTMPKSCVSLLNIYLMPVKLPVRKQL